MVCFRTVGFTLSVVVVLEFDSACWAVCDAQCLCSCEYLFSKLFVFFCACSAHRVSLFCVWCCCVVLGGGASQRQRDERLHRLTLLSTLCSLSPFSSLFFLLSFLWNGGCRVVRAQLCEHARDTTLAFVFCGFVYLMCRVLLLSQRSVCCPHHTLFIVNDSHAHH